MTEKTVPFALNALLYFLNYIPDVNKDPIIPDSLVKQIKEKYKPELVKGFHEAVEWVKENQGFNFKTRIPLRQENTEILIYFEKLDALFKGNRWVKFAFEALTLLVGIKLISSVLLS